MHQIKCLIIDDDPLITDLLMHFSEKCELIEYSVVCNNSTEGLKLLNNSSFDVLFLDYNMPLLNGQDLLEIKQDNSKVVMITSNTDFAVNSYKYDAVCDYLVKPIDYDSFHDSVLRIYTKIKSHLSSPEVEPKSTLMVKDGSNWVPIAYDSIFYIKSESNYCIFHTQNGKIMSLANLKMLAEKLPKNFLRCHRSYIINTNYIDHINLELISVKKEIIPISALYKNEIKSFIASNS